MRLLQIRAIILLFLGSCGFLALRFFREGEFINSCYAERYLRSASDRSVDLLLFRSSVAVLVLYLVFFTLKRDRKRFLGIGVTLEGMVVVLSTHLWYLCSYMVVMYLKANFKDAMCSKHTNSVSGHANFYIFSNLALYQMIPYSTWKRGSRLLWTCFLTLSIITLTCTYAGGYHSPLQMLLGAAFGLASAGLFSLTVADDLLPHRVSLIIGFSGDSTSNTGRVHSFPIATYRFLLHLLGLAVVAAVLWMVDHARVSVFEALVLPNVELCSACVLYYYIRRADRVPKPKKAVKTQ